MDDHGFPALAAAMAFLLGGLLAEFIQGTIALIGGTIALGATCGHYLGRLRGFSEHRRRRAEEIGFVLGLCVGVAVAILDALAGA